MASETNIKRRDSMWIFFAFGSAIFAGLTSILAKCGIKTQIQMWQQPLEL